MRWPAATLSGTGGSFGGEARSIMAQSIQALRFSLLVSRSAIALRPSRFGSHRQLRDISHTSTLNLLVSLGLRAAFARVAASGTEIRGRDTSLPSRRHQKVNELEPEERREPCQPLKTRGFSPNFMATERFPNFKAIGSCDPRRIVICQMGDAGWSSPVARQAHNLKAAGSNPAPATNFQKALEFSRAFLLLQSGFLKPPAQPAGNAESIASQKGGFNSSVRLGNDHSLRWSAAVHPQSEGLRDLLASWRLPRWAGARICERDWHSKLVACDSKVPDRVRRGYPKPLRGNAPPRLSVSSL